MVKRGLSKLGQHDYDVFNYNCEHWANWCRNGNTISMQVNHMDTAIVYVLTSVSETSIYNLLISLLDSWIRANHQAQTIIIIVNPTPDMYSDWFQLQADAAEAKLEEVKNKPKHLLDDLKEKVDEKVDKLKKGPKPPENIQIPDDALEKLPFLKKFNAMKVED